MPENTLRTPYLLRTADSLAARIGLLQRPLDADALLQAARRRTGLQDLGDISLREPLQIFLAACASEAGLSLVGRLATRWDALRFLSNLLRLREAEVRAPEILRQPITRPIFITGLPRSGTSFLHRLLMEDPANRAPRVWQTIYPYPEPRDRRIDRRRQRVQRQLRAFERLAPEFRARHPLDAQSPQECTEITAHVFRSLRFDTNYHIPSYRHWIDQRGHVEAYRFHRRFLQHLQQQSPDPGRWVLKCPDHVFALDSLRQIYPDAGLVFVHRNPLDVLASNAHLTGILRRPFTRQLDLEAIGRQESARWLMGTKLMVAADTKLDVHNVQYRDLIADPLATIDRLYCHFDMVLPPRAADRITRRVAAAPNGGYGRVDHNLAQYGLDPDAEARNYQGYTQHFGVQAPA